MMISKNFDLREVVNPAIYHNPAVGVRCATFLHFKTGQTLEGIKRATGDVITINDWMYATNKSDYSDRYTDSGLREPMKPLPSEDAVLNLIDVYKHDGKALVAQMHKLYKSIGAILSSHKFGLGFDLKFKKMTAEEAHAFILKNQHLFPYIARMESIEATKDKPNRRGWVHIELGDKRESDQSIIVFNP